LGENFTLFRGESGTTHLVGQRCAHRGLALSAGSVEGDCIRCFYHGWKYDQTGQCVEQPAEKKGFSEKVKIAGYPVQEYLGLIFAYFGEGEPPRFPTFEAFEGEGFFDSRATWRDWPFFYQLENSVDEVHFNFVHRRSAFTDAGLNDEIPEILCEETDYGIARIGRRRNQERRSHIIMPNCMFTMVFDHLKGWCEHIAWRVPVDEATHISFIVDFVHKCGEDAESYRRQREAQKAKLKSLEPVGEVARRILDGEILLEELSDRPDLLAIQDAVAMIGQGEERDRREDLLGTSDRQVALLRHIWQREMSAIEKSQPTKSWRIPSDLQVTKGVEQLN
jgi:5,5'-dehydrodivanillate O-demethylase